MIGPEKKKKESPRKTQVCFSRFEFSPGTTKAVKNGMPKIDERVEREGLRRAKVKSSYLSFFVLLPNALRANLEEKINRHQQQVLYWCCSKQMPPLLTRAGEIASGGNGLFLGILLLLLLYEEGKKRLPGCLSAREREREKMASLDVVVSYYKHKA